MTKHILQFALLALAWPQLAAAETSVSLDSADKYIFSTPLLTNHIRGVLMGVGTNTYGVIRSEDIDWITEALSERQSLSAGRASNFTGVGHPVGRYDMPDVYTRGTWLDGEAPLLTGCRFFVSGQSYTNISVQTSYTNGVTNAFSVITMPLTNGTESVFTNSWSFGRPGGTWTSGLRLPVTTVVTNIHTLNNVDRCHGVEGVPFPELTNATPSRIDQIRATLGAIPNAQYVIAVRESLRGCVRLADDVYYFTNDAPYIIDEFADGRYYTDIVDVGYNFNLDSYEFRRNPASTAYIPTRFDSSLVTTGGVSRVAIEAVYAYGGFRYSDVGTYVNKTYMLRLSNPSLNLSAEKAVCCIVVDPHSLCSACASAAGVPMPPSSFPDSGIGTQAWAFHVGGFVVFYRITPSVRLPSWTEENPDQ